MRRVVPAVLMLSVSYLMGLALYGETSQKAVALLRAHAHNDYEHERPLLDALDQGFCNVEADVSLTPQGLLVAHDLKDVKADRTLESLYLKPLRERVTANGGFVIAKGVPLTLLIDIKSEAERTYSAIDELLARNADILSVTRDGEHRVGAVTVVISGNRPIETMRRQAVRYAGIDGRTSDLVESTQTPPDLMPWISARWGEDATLSSFRWKGDGPIPAAERERLRAYVQLAHAQKRKVRFWATPEKPEFWKELVAAEVDLIGTDKLAELKEFLSQATTTTK